MSAAKSNSSITRIALAALIAVFAVFTVVLCGCSSQAKGSETLEATFEANAGTGYEWTCAVEDESLVVIADQSVTSELQEQIAGGPETYKFVLEAAENAADGKTNVTFTFARSWEENPDDVTATWEVSVEDGLLSIGSYDGPNDYKDALAIPEK
jgi:predicted secreted protein